jgi:hypothetical protein
MGKKQVAVSLRKPPPVDPNAFVAGGAEAAAPAPAPLHAVEGPVLPTRAGERRELTIYLPQDLARELSIHCMELDRDVSNVVSEALAKALLAKDAEPVAVTVPEDRWTRVRSILGDLRARLPKPLRIGFLF